MGAHTGSGKGNADQGNGRHREGLDPREEQSMSAAARVQARREGGYDVGGNSSTRAAQRGSDKGQTHQRD